VSQASAGLEEYLDELGKRLGRRPEAVRDVVDELRDHLLEATDAHRARGAGAGGAVERALRELGPAAEVAESLRPVTAQRCARSAATRAMLVYLIVFDLGFFAFLLVPVMRSATLDPASMPGLELCEWFGRLGLVSAIAMLVLSRSHRAWSRRGWRPLIGLILGFGWLLVLSNAVVAPLLLERLALAFGLWLPLPWMLAGGLAAGFATALLVRPAPGVRLRQLEQ